MLDLTKAAFLDEKNRALGDFLHEKETLNDTLEKDWQAFLLNPPLWAATQEYNSRCRDSSLDNRRI